MSLDTDVFTDPRKTFLLGNPLFGAKTLHKGRKKLEDSLKPPEIPKAPQIDDARSNREEFDRIRRRRGVLANLFGGASNSTPTTGGAELLGG